MYLVYVCLFVCLYVCVYVCVCRLHLAHMGSFSSRVSFSARMLVQSLTMANEQRTNSRILSPTSQSSMTSIVGDARIRKAERPGKRARRIYINSRNIMRFFVENRNRCGE